MNVEDKIGACRFMIDALDNRVKALEAGVGKPGTGRCICLIAPSYIDQAAEQWGIKFENVDLKMQLDHRCSKHGYVAQPKLWGRNKGLELVVTPAQWLSLGVVYP